MHVTASSLSVAPSAGVVTRVFRPIGPSRWPGVVLAPDELGVRPALEAAAGSLAAAGFVVVLAYGSKGGSAFSDPDRAARMFETLLRGRGVLGDRLGLVGFGEGAAEALRAADALPEHVAAVAALDGAAPVAAALDQGRLTLERIDAQVYLAHADDRGDAAAAAARARIEAAFKGAGVWFESEVCRGAGPGFAVQDRQGFDPAAAAHAWLKVGELMERVLSPVQ